MCFAYKNLCLWKYVISVSKTSGENSLFLEKLYIDIKVLNLYSNNMHSAVLLPRGTL